MTKVRNEKVNGFAFTRKLTTFYTLLSPKEGKRLSSLVASGDDKPYQALKWRQMVGGHWEFHQR